MSSGNPLAELGKALDIPTRFFAAVLNDVPKCPHCSRAFPTLTCLWSSHAPVPRATPGHIRVWAAYGCTGCGGVVLAKGTNHIAGRPDGILELIPQTKQANRDIPDPARTFLQQAFDTLHAPDAAAVMAGSAVDAMLKELGYDNGSVYARIDQAVADHKLTEAMGAWAHEVRLGSNRPRHADKEQPHVTADQAANAVEFADALGFFLFVLNERVTRGRKAAAEPEDLLGRLEAAGSIRMHRSL